MINVPKIFILNPIQIRGNKLDTSQYDLIPTSEPGVCVKVSRIPTKGQGNVSRIPDTYSRPNTTAIFS